MSVKKNLNELSDKEKHKVDEELTIKLKSSIRNVPPKIIVTYNVDDSDDVILPFAYGISNLLLPFSTKQCLPRYARRLYATQNRISAKGLEANPSKNGWSHDCYRCKLG